VLDKNSLHVMEARLFPHTGSAMLDETGIAIIYAAS
jgi:hypothetical protein